MSVSSAARLDVVGVGTAVVDYLGVVEHYPVIDTQVELQSFSKQPGGNVATALVTLARLGCKTAFLGKFGDDELARFVKSRLHEEGVDISGCRLQTGGSVGFAFIIVEAGSGRRTILFTGEGKCHLRADEIDADAIRRCRYLHLDHYSMDAALAAAKIAKQSGVQVVLDAEALGQGIEKLLPLVDVLIACADFAHQYTGLFDNEMALDALFDATPAHTVAITAGDLGSYCRTAAERHRQPAFAVDPVDTTGCGDVYHGAFIHGLLQQWPLATIARFASGAAALNCRSLGGQSGIPHLADIEAFLRTAKSLAT